MNIKYLLITLISYLRRKDKRYLISEAVAQKGRKGIEIGGPSSFFNVKGGMPVYLFASQIDGVNFSDDTVWEGHIKRGKNYNYFNNKKGYQYIAEATDLSEIPSDTYEFVLSCHSLEHVANPLKAIYEWKRILKKGGKLILVLPEKGNTFDNNRPFTSLQHLLTDFNNNIGEGDRTHFDEIISLHNYGRDTGTASVEDFKARLLDNSTNRCAHHHVFSLDVVAQMLSYCGFSIEHQQQLPPFHLITVAIKN